MNIRERLQPLGDNTTSIPSRQPTIKVKVGGKAKTSDGREYPMSLDYFEIDGPLREAFSRKFKDPNDPTAKGPKQLMIVFPFEDMNKNIAVQYLWRDKAGKKVAYSPNGVVFFAWSQETKGFVQVDKKNPAVDPATAKTNCVITFLLPEWKTTATLFRFDTNGKDSTIPAIINAYDMVQSIAGIVQAIPFRLYVKKEKSNTPSGTLYPVVSMECMFSFVELNLIRQYLESGHTLASIVGIDSYIDVEKLHQWSKEAGINTTQKLPEQAQQAAMLSLPPAAMLSLPPAPEMPKATVIDIPQAESVKNPTIQTGSDSKAAETKSGKLFS